MTVTDRFLKAKHWQLFFLTCGVPIIFQFVMITTMLASIGSEQESTEPTFLNSILFFPLIMIVFVGTFFGWFWAIAFGLQNKIPAGVEMKTGIFKIFFFFPITYMILISVLWRCQSAE